MLKRVSILFLVGCSHLLVPVEPQQPMGIVQSTINSDQCLRQVYLGNGPWIELADCSVSDQNQWVLLYDLEELGNDFTYFQFYNSQIAPGPPPSLPTVAPPTGSMSRPSPIGQFSPVTGMLVQSPVAPPQPIPPPPPMSLPLPPPIGMCLSLYGDANINQYPVLSWDCCRQDNQMWQIINGAYNTSFQLQLKYTGNCLTLDSDTKYATQATCLDPNDAAVQTWVIKPFDPRARLLQSQKNPSMCLSYVGNSNDPYEVNLVNCDQTDASQLAYPLYTNTTGQTLAGIQFFMSDVLIYAVFADATQENNFVLQFFDNCLTIATDESGNSVGLQPCASGALSQAWTIFDPNPSITFNNIKTTTLEHQSTGLCLQPGSDGSNYALVSCDTTGIELMAPIDWEYGTTTLTPGYLQFSGNCLTGEEPGSSVTQLACKGDTYQRWYILASEDPSAIQLQNSLNTNWCLAAEETLTYIYVSNCTDPDQAKNQMWIIGDGTQ